MAKMTFFRQGRADGGIRTGIDLHGDTIWHHFDEGGDEVDPTLRWYVDVRCEGASVPSRPDRAPRWLLDQSQLVTAALLALADELQVGIDGDYFPVQHVVAGAPKGAKIVIACSAMKRLSGRAVAKLVRDIAKQWAKYIGQLQAPLPAG